MRHNAEVPLLNPFSPFYGLIFCLFSALLTTSPRPELLGAGSRSAHLQGPCKDCCATRCSLTTKDFLCFVSRIPSAASVWKTEEYREWCTKRPLEKKDHSDKTWNWFIFSLCLKSNGVGTHLFSSKSRAQLRLFSHKWAVWVTAEKWVCADLHPPQSQVNGLLRKKLCSKQVSQPEMRGDPGNTCPVSRTSG